MSIGQNVYIPDANFKNYLVNNSAINTNGDSEIQVSEASAFTGTINCSSQNISGLTISDLTGIEAFTALTDLRCAYNQLTSLDVSSNTALTFFNCGYNQLTSLNVSSNTALTELYCGENNISSLDVSSNTALTNLNCGYNQLTSLDVFNNTALTLFTCPNNQLTSLDVSSNTALTQFICHQNYLTSLDVSNNTALTDLFCHWNQLECLNVKNGNNTDISNFFAYNNPSLTCIEVDDVNYSNNNWTSNNNLNYIDPQTSFSTDCGNDCAACIPTSSIDFHTACDSYTWIDGNNYTASNNTATYTTTNAEGCDSTITLDLTIWSAPEPTIIQNGSTLACTNFASGYQWLDCNENYDPIIEETGMTFTATQSGNYALEISFNDCSDTSECFSIDLTGIGELNNTPKQLIKIVDVLGRETPFKPNTPLLYIYNDGTVERKMIIKE